MSAALALKEAASIYEGVPERPTGEASSDFLAVVKGHVDVADRMTRDRKIKAIQERAKINEFFQTMTASLDGVTQEVMDELSSATDALSNQIVEHSASVAQVEREAESILREAGEMKLPTQTVKAIRKEFSRFIDAGKEMHSDAVEMYYFLLSLKAELDPDANVGPSFDNPDELKAYLDAELAD